MTRSSQFRSPFLLGFEGLERLLDQLSKTTDGYPPYNIERLDGSEAEAYRITLAVAGFAENDLSVTLEDKQLVIRGRHAPENAHNYLHRGIAARQFQRSFLIADGVEVTGAKLDNGLLSVDFIRKEPEKRIERINIEGTGAGLKPVSIRTGTPPNERTKEKDA